MLQFKHPGVYTQEIPSGVRTITGASTSVALFVGPTLTGNDGRATRLFNFGDFERSFGGLSQTSNLSYSVLHFFANGGSEAYVIRVPAEGATAALSQFKQDGINTLASLINTGPWAFLWDSDCSFLNTPLPTLSRTITRERPAKMLEIKKR